MTVSPNVRITGDSTPYVEPHLAANPREPANLVVAAMAFPAAGRGAVIRVFFSVDGGATWTRARVDSAEVVGIDPFCAPAAFRAAGAPIAFASGPLRSQLKRTGFVRRRVVVATPWFDKPRARVGGLGTHS